MCVFNACTNYYFYRKYFCDFLPISYNTYIVTIEQAEAQNVLVVSPVTLGSALGVNGEHLPSTRLCV